MLAVTWAGISEEERMKLGTRCVTATSGSKVELVQDGEYSIIPRFRRLLLSRVSCICRIWVQLEI